MLCAPKLCAAALSQVAALYQYVFCPIRAPLSMPGAAAIGKDAACQCSIEWDGATDDPSPGYPPATSQRLKGGHDMPSNQAGC